MPIVPKTDPCNHSLIFVHTFHKFTPDEHKETMSVSLMAHIQMFYLERKTCTWLFHLNSKNVFIMIVFDNHTFQLVCTSNNRRSGKKLSIRHIILPKEVAPKTISECIKSKQKL